MKNKKITIKDIARLAGVSTTTVSFAFNNPERVNNKTLEKVLSVSKKLNYSPNVMAGALRGKSNVIAIILNFHYDEMTHNPTIMEGFPLILQSITNMGFYAMPFFQQPSEYENSSLFSLIRNKQIAGAFFLASRTDVSMLDVLIKNKIPISVIGTIPSHQHKIYSVDNDNEKDAYTTTKILYEKHYKKIAYISGSIDYLVCKQRLNGYKKAVREIGIHKPISYGFSEDRLEIEKAVREILESKELVDVIIAKDDIKGIYIVSELDKNNIKVGKDIGVVSIGGSKASTYSNPELSSLKFSIEDLVFKAIKNLDYQIKKNKIIVKRDIVETTFLHRASLKN